MRREKSLCDSEAKEEVEAHGSMVVVIGDVESDNFLFLLTLILNEGKDEAAIGNTCRFHGELLLAPVDERLVGHFVAIRHLETQVLPLAKVGGIEGTSAEYHAEHIEDALLGAVLLIEDESLVVLEALLELDAIGGRIAVPHLVNVVAFPLESSLAVVEWFELGSDIGEKGIAHHEELVGALVAAGDEMATVGLLPLIGGVGDIQVCRSGLHPDEFPVEIELIVQVLAALESFVLEGALCDGRHSGYDGQKE